MNADREELESRPNVRIVCERAGTYDADSAILEAIDAVLTEKDASLVAANEKVYQLSVIAMRAKEIADYIDERGGQKLEGHIAGLFDLLDELQQSRSDYMELVAKKHGKEKP